MSTRPLRTKREDLKEHHVYELWSRNLLTGVWDGHAFIGIREKFGMLRLDVETFNDPPGNGTVTHARRIGPLPRRVELTEGWIRGERPNTTWETNWLLACLLMQYPHPAGEWLEPDEESDDD